MAEITKGRLDKRETWANKYLLNWEKYKYAWGSTAVLDPQKTCNTANRVYFYLLNS